jgi:hypothetical protein
VSNYKVVPVKIPVEFCIPICYKGKCSSTRGLQAEEVYKSVDYKLGFLFGLPVQRVPLAAGCFT